MGLAQTARRRLPGVEAAIQEKHRYQVVAVAASAGGIKALQSLLAALPASFPLPIVVVQHMDPNHPSMLVPIMRRASEMKIEAATQGQRLEGGTVYFAAPNRHLLVSPEQRLELVDSELVHFVRPSADLLFESLAASCKAGVIGVILTGNGKDASQGAIAIKKMGGTVLAQAEDDAEFPGMPRSAIATGSVDYVLPLKDIPAQIISLVGVVE